jgi:hypothetical protein
LTGDGDTVDTNDLLGAFPGVATYSPMLRVHRARVAAARDGEVALVDTTGDQEQSDLRDAAALDGAVAEGLLEEAEALAEDEVGVAIPSNDGAVFRHCPVQVGGD